MPQSESITELSLKELVSIFRLLGSREADEERPGAVLMGGWAVYSYNRYHGSTDVDILAPNRLRDSLIRGLKRSRGYEYRPLEDGEKPQLYRDFESGRVIVEVLDDGPGVDPETAREIFDPFFTTSSAGTGLGLYVARELAATNGAQLDYAPRPSGGSRFRVTFAV
jgi:signal transduction histidine kinase